MATAEALLTAEEYARLPDDWQPTELVRGRVVPVNMPYPRHGEICACIVSLLWRHLEDHPSGRIVSNDSGIVTERDPDTVRGADVAFYSYEDVPKGPLPQRYLTAVPRLVFEVRSPSDRWKDLLAKTVEYLNAGVMVVCVLDPDTQTVHVYRPDQPDQTFAADQELPLPDLLPGFQVRVGRFFE
jgi:Uma2 family endonuclease